MSEPSWSQRVLGLTPEEEAASDAVLVEMDAEADRVLARWAHLGLDQACCGEPEWSRKGLGRPSEYVSSDLPGEPADTAVAVPSRPVLRLVDPGDELSTSPPA